MIDFLGSSFLTLYMTAKETAVNKDEFASLDLPGTRGQFDFRS